MSPETQSSRRRRLYVRAASLVLAAGLLGWVGWSGRVLWIHTAADIRARACRLNINALSRAMQMYLADNAQAFPPANAWCDRLASYLPDAGVFVCPSTRDRQCSYALSGPLGGMTVGMTEDVEHTVALFESDDGWNAAGGPELLPDRPRHSGGDEYAFADGRTLWIARKEIQDAHGNWRWAKETDGHGFPVRWEPTVEPSAAERSRR